MPNTYAQVNAKKYLDAAGLTYLAQKLNNYPNNDVIAAVIDGVQDALDEKLDISSYNAPDTIEDEQIDALFTTV